MPLHRLSVTNINPHSWSSAEYNTPPPVHCHSGIPSCPSLELESVESQLKLQTSNEFCTWRFILRKTLLKQARHSTIFVCKKNLILQGLIKLFKSDSQCIYKAKTNLFCSLCEHKRLIFNLADPIIQLSRYSPHPAPVWLHLLTSCIPTGVIWLGELWDYPSVHERSQAATYSFLSVVRYQSMCPV